MGSPSHSFPETQVKDSDSTNSSPKQTLGEIRVRTKFNPSDDSKVQHIKERAAEFINYVNDNIEAKDGEVGRLKSLALTCMEEAAQWAVKAATA